MPRPTKCRKLCHYPRNLLFSPAEAEGSEIILSLDEYEALRLIDHEGLSQERCSEKMQVARTTVQKIYVSARKKIAGALVEARPLRLGGGDVRLCDGMDGYCSASDCPRRMIRKKHEKPKGENIMRIAVTYENGEIFQHFGHTSEFKVYDVENDAIIGSEVISTGGSGHGALAGVLCALHADVLICGGIGGGAQNALNMAGIRWYAGVCGSADAAVAAFLAGKLDYDPEAKCSHHEHHHGEGHQCGSHGCGKNSCH